MIKEIIAFFNERKVLRRKNALLKKQNKRLKEQNEFLKTTIYEFVLELSSRKIVVNEAAGRKNVAVEKPAKTELADFQNYTPVEKEDQVYTDVIKKMSNPDTLGSLENEQLLRYREINGNDFEKVVNYTKENQTEAKISLNDTTQMILSGHPDNSLSASFYDVTDGQMEHLRSISTAENEFSPSYSENDMISLINSYANGDV